MDEKSVVFRVQYNTEFAVVVVVVGKVFFNIYLLFESITSIILLVTSTRTAYI